MAQSHLYKSRMGNGKFLLESFPAEIFSPTPIEDPLSAHLARLRHKWTLGELVSRDEQLLPDQA